MVIRLLISWLMTGFSNDRSFFRVLIESLYKGIFFLVYKAFFFQFFYDLNIYKKGEHMQILFHFDHLKKLREQQIPQRSIFIGTPIKNCD